MLRINQHGGADNSQCGVKGIVHRVMGDCSGEEGDCNGTVSQSMRLVVVALVQPKHGKEC